MRRFSFVKGHFYMGFSLQAACFLDRGETFEKEESVSC